MKQLSNSILYKQFLDGSLCGVEANVLVCGIIVSKFKLQSLYYVHFGTNIPGLGGATAALLKGWLWYKITHED